MAVQQNKKSRSRRGMRRSHDAVSYTESLTSDPVTGETHRRHHVSADGYYKGREILQSKEKAQDKETEE